MLSVNDNFGGISGTIQKHCAVHYGNTGCRVFKFERFLPKNQHNQRKLLCQKWVPKLIFFNQKIIEKDFNDF